MRSNVRSAKSGNNSAAAVLGLTHRSLRASDDLLPSPE